MSPFFNSIGLLVILWINHSHVGSSLVQITTSNLQETLDQHELVFVNFYADWCYFSQLLSPIFEEASKAVDSEFNGRVVLGRVNCDNENALAQRFRVTKYPTLKLFRYGVPLKREYRSTRAKESFLQYLRDELKSSIENVDSYESIAFLPDKKYIVGYIPVSESPVAKLFNKVASAFRDDCQFVVLLQPYNVAKGLNDSISEAFVAINEDHEEIRYQGDVNTFEAIQTWASERCVPLVRVLTFQNAEELTEEGLPFMILFHHPDDKETPRKFREYCTSDLSPERSTVLFLTADGLQFSHPLHHLSKDAKDLPIIAIDSFKHMYVFPFSLEDGLQKGNTLLKTFIADLHSGKLHREFHYGPDPVELPAADSAKTGSNSHIPRDSSATDSSHHGSGDNTQPPESIFKKLAPSRSRYSILDKDEL